MDTQGKFIALMDFLEDQYRVKIIDGSIIDAQAIRVEIEKWSEMLLKLKKNSGTLSDNKAQ